MDEEEDGRASGLATIAQPASDDAPGFELVVDLINGKYVAVELTLFAPRGAGLKRSDLYAFDLQRKVDAAARAAREPKPEYPPEVTLEIQLEDLQERLVDPDTSESGRLMAVARLYRTAKLTGTPLHVVAERLGVHKKTLQRWARQAEAAGHLLAQDRRW